MYYIIAWIGIQIMHFEKFYVATMLTGALKGDKSLKMPSDSILGGVIFQNFLRVLILTSPKSTILTNLVASHPFQKSRSVPANYCDYLYTLYGIVFSPPQGVHQHNK